MHKITLSLLLLAACSHLENPCLPGYQVERTTGRCLERGAVQNPSDMDGGDVVSSLDGSDDGALNGSNPDDGGTTRLDVGTADARAQDAMPGDATPGDADWPLNLEDATLYDARTCLVEGGGSDFVFTYSDAGIADAIGSCYARCAYEAACARDCMVQITGPNTCDYCSAQHAACTTRFCPDACKSGSNDDQCRACMCEARCFDVFAACYGHTINYVCERYPLGTLPKPNDPALSAPLLLREQASTGQFDAMRVDSEGGPWTSTFKRTASRYTGVLVAFPLAGREYVLRNKADYPDPGSFLRIMALQANGELAKPQLDQPWDGVREMDALVVDGTPYVASLLGRNLRVNRVDLVNSVISFDQVVEIVFDAAYQQPFDVLEPFKIGATTYLLAYKRDGQTASASFSGTTLTFVPSDALSDRPDVLETFKINGQWVLFTYQNASGTATLRTITHSGGRIGFGTTPLYQQRWGRMVTHAVGVVGTSESQLFVHDADSARTTLYTVGSDFVLNEKHSDAHLAANKPWDVMEVAGQNKW